MLALESFLFEKKYYLVAFILIFGHFKQLKRPNFANTKDNLH
jgi:hypothetical protein